MRREIGIDIHQTFGEVVIREDGVRRREGLLEMSPTAREGFGPDEGRPLPPRR